jgi:hypothetical protein
MPSNMVSTVLQDYISNYQPRLDQFEQRPSEYGAMNLFNNQTNSPNSILDDQVKANIEKSFNQSVKVPVINYKDVSIGNVRTCAMRSDGLTSQLVTLTAVTYAWGFVAYPEQHYENYIQYSTAISKLMDAGLQKLAATIDAGCVNLLETNKNQYFPQAMLDFYAQVGNAFQVPQASKDFFYNNLGSIMSTADFAGIPDVTTNHIGMAMVRKIAAQGQGNSVNQGFQLLGYVWYPTNRITNGAGTVESTLYAVAPGAVALASRIDPDSKHRARIHESKYWETFPNAPYINRELGVFYQADCADASALQAATLAGLTRTKVESWEFSLDVFYIKPYVSDVVNHYSPIFKAEILK